MEQLPAYEIDPRQCRLRTRVIATGEEQGRAWAILEDTVLYPEGGGQPADHGWLAGAEVTDVRRAADGIRHYTTRPVALGEAEIRLDWDRRFDHMQQHTGQHLLTAVALERFGWRTTAFHLGERLSDIELDVATLAPAQLAELEEAVAAEIRSSRPVTARRVTAEEYQTLPVRSRGLPAGHTGPIRLVEIAGIDLNTCGGTHLASTAELEALSLLGTEPMRGGTRVFFAAGRRLRRRLAEHEQRMAALRATVGCADDEMPEVIALKLEQLRAAERRGREAEEQLADALANSLAARGERLLELHLEDRDAAFLQRLARALATAAPERSAVLTATSGGAAFFLVLASESAAPRLQEAGRAVAAALGGRGGGSGRTFQGKAERLSGRAEALAAARSLLAP